jgi:hypothetical protein
MTDKDTVLTISVSREERQQIEKLARRRGYDTPEDYLLALVKSDAEAQGETLPLTERFRRSLQDAIAGKTYPISTLWDGIDDE